MKNTQCLVSLLISYHEDCLREPVDSFLWNDRKSTAGTGWPLYLRGANRRYPWRKNQESDYRPISV